MQEKDEPWEMEVVGREEREQRERELCKQRRAEYGIFQAEAHSREGLRPRQKTVHHDAVVYSVLNTQ